MARGSRCCSVAAAAAVLSLAAGQKFSEKPFPRQGYPLIAGYKPATDVSQQSFLDLDVAEMESVLTNAGGPVFGVAKLIYTMGGNSGGYADVLIGNPLESALAEGAEVKQRYRPAAKGFVMADTPAGATAIQVKYASTCKAGGLTPDVSGCFTAGNGNLTVGDVNIRPRAIKNSYLTLAGIATAAPVTMVGQEVFAAYQDYYSGGVYAHQRVLDALDGSGSCSTCDPAARAEIAQKAPVYLGVWMHVISQMEHAIMQCRSGCRGCSHGPVYGPVHSWDKAVAFYAGSLEGTLGSTSGKMIHHLVDELCSQFGTCSEDDVGVNNKIMEQFMQGKAKLLAGLCAEVTPIRKRITSLMTVPLVQGALRSAYQVAKLEGGSRERAQADVFSSAVLPRIAQCDATAAKTIADSLAYSASASLGEAEFSKVKAAFESTYSCLDITCKDIQGLVVTGKNGYYAGFKPCKFSFCKCRCGCNVVCSKARRMVPLIAVGVPTLIALVAAVVCALKALKYKRLLEKERESGQAAAPVSTNGR